jgi:hypothetical protein
LRRALLLIALALATGLLKVTPALATDPSGLTTDFLLSPLPGGKATFDEIDIYAKTDLNPTKPTDFWKALISTKGASDLYVVRNTFEPKLLCKRGVQPGGILTPVLA